MKRNYLFLYGCLLLLVCSCGKTDARHKLDKIDTRKAAEELFTDNPTDIMGFYSFIETPTNGTFGLTSFTHYGYRFPQPTRIPRDSSYNNYEFNGAFYDANKNPIPGGTVRFGRLEFYPDPALGNFYSMNSYNVVVPSTSFSPIKYPSVQEQTWNYTIDPVPGGTTARGATAPVSGSLYFPRDANFSTNGPKTQLGNNYFDAWVYDFFTAPAGTLTINWGVDPNNDKGVVIAIEYDYDFSAVFYPASPASTKKLYKALRVPDNGSYTLQMTDLNLMFPQRDIYQPFNALIHITVGRANYAITASADGLQKYAVYAGSAAERTVMVNWKARPRITN